MRSSSSPVAAPAHGDLIIAKDTAKEDAYTIGVVPGLPQVCCPTYERAIATARAWASRRPVTTWFTEDGTAFTMLDTKRKRMPSR